MKIGKRNPGQLFKAIIGKQHYIAFLNSLAVYPDFFDSFARYFLGRGSYPVKVKIRTPEGIVSPFLFSYFDMLTVNEVFCRKDYKADKGVKTVVDIGSNIGISALYFLTRNNFSRCYLFEPVPRNVSRLKENLKDFNGRYELEEAAVSNNSGIFRFGTDPYGRYGGLLREAENYIHVKCLNINDVLEKILKEEERIDILKIDTEGSEFDIVKAISKSFFKKIHKIYIEIDHTVNFNDSLIIFPEYEQHRYGNTLRLELKK